ncbi:hypothetical protein DSCW_09380 [Desulfosarcina widdelii]|uniref:Uncharacterized protein n=1 Tax=Desulfosarcina widdelii TaxID=947919 RepID=A0A5K7Z1Y9_9BACT|nr:hypothetical protein DSCW_09380 [Desulfosarcina widdelii]
MLICVHPKEAFCGPCRRSPIFAILNVALLRLRLRKCCGLGLTHKLPLLDEHKFNALYFDTD